MHHDLVRSPIALDQKSKNEAALSWLSYIVIVRFVSTRQTRWYLCYCSTMHISKVKNEKEKIIRGERFRSKTAFLNSVTSGG